MFLEPDPVKDHSQTYQSAQLNHKPIDVQNPDSKSHLLDETFENTQKPGASAPQELTLSYLCDNPKVGLQGKDGLGTDFLGSTAKNRAKGKEIAPESLDDEEPRWVERDFLQLSGGGGGNRGQPKREIGEGGDGENREKKARIETLNLSLGLPDLSLSLNSANPVPTAAPAPIPTNHVPPKRTSSNNTWATNSDDCGASISYSYSHPFSHNPSCSLTRNSTENYDNDTTWYCGGEGTNGSVHSRFKPVGDGNTITFSNNVKEMNNSVYGGNSISENHSSFPSELPARPIKANGLTSLDSGRNVMVGRPDRLLREIVSESVPIMAQIIQELPSDSLAAVKEGLRNLIDVPEKKEEFASLQRRLERRSDLTSETLSKAHKAQLEILVGIKTGIGEYLSAMNQLPSAELVEIFLLTRCKNLSCKSLLPVDDCDCKICSSKKGFCSACMCPICSKFDCASNTCSWVGCDVCSHWCHAVCGIQKNLIRPGPSKGTAGMMEMQFQCLGCGHSSEMFGFVKEVFTCCAKDWGLETLVKELDCVRKIFNGSKDLEEKELYRKAEEMLTMLSKKLISTTDACNGILQFFKYGAANFSVTGSSSRGVLTAESSQRGNGHPLPPPPTIISPKPASDMKPSILDTQLDAPKLESKPFAPEPYFSTKKKETDGFQSLESMVRFKEAEARLFQRLADDAKRGVDGYIQIARAKNEKLEEDYASKLAKLCLQETEDRRRKKLEELKFLENSHCDYHKMKIRMQAEIAGLLERMEATKKQWV